MFTKILDILTTSVYKVTSLLFARSHQVESMRPSGPSNTECLFQLANLVASN